VRPATGARCREALWLVEENAVTEVAQGLVHDEEAILAAFLKLPVAVAILDCDLRFVAVNEAMAVVNGLPPDEHVGRLATELLPALDLDTWDALRDVIATGRPKTFLVRGQTQAGETDGAWQEQFHPWRSHADGEIRGVVATAIDVTEQRRLQLTAARQQAFLTGLAQLSAGLVGAAGEAEAAQLLAEHAAAILGADAALVAVGRHGEAARVVAAHGFPPQALDELAQFGPGTAVGDTARTGTPHAFVAGPEWEAAFPGGAEFHRRAGLAATATVALVVEKASVGALALSFRGPHIPGDEDRLVLATIGSIGGQAMERARVADERRREHVMRSAFLDIIAHELKTPLATIYGGLETVALHAATLDPAARDELLADATAETRRLVRLVDDLVVLSRLEHGLQPDLLEPLMLTHLSRVVVEAFTASTGIEVALSVPRDIPPVRGEASYVEQVLRNLLSNAVKYGRPPYEVAVRVEASEVAVRMLDAGDGLPADHTRLWELYYRDPLAARGRPGTGIGLFVCRELITLMGGRMWATDRPTGGAEFGFALPAWDAE